MSNLSWANKEESSLSCSFCERLLALALSLTALSFSEHREVLLSAVNASVGSNHKKTFCDLHLLQKSRVVKWSSLSFLLFVCILYSIEFPRPTASVDSHIFLFPLAASAVREIELEGEGGRGIMPVKPQFEWEQTSEDVLLEVVFKGCKKDSVDVLVADMFVKVNASPQYLLAIDLLHKIDPEKSTHYFAERLDGLSLHVKLHKAEPEIVWDALSLRQSSIGKAALLQRRQESMQRAEQRYSAQLNARVMQRETERRRMQEAQWEVEKEQRAHIEEKVKAEKDAAEHELFEWEEGQKGNASSAPPQSPADIYVNRLVGGTETQRASHQDLVPAAVTAIPAIRQADTVNVIIDFTPKTFAMPTRSRGDEDYYRQSRYKPVSIEDTPMFWKERADKHYRAHEWKAAADAYSESIKRDGAFLTCVMNRAACFLHLADYKRAIDDCSLALTMLSNTPASEVTQDRYRGLMTKLYARRGAAYCWADDLRSGVADLRMAAAYRDPINDEDVSADLALVEAQMQQRGITDDTEGSDPLSTRLQEAATQYYNGSYEAAEATYRAVLSENRFNAKAQSNLVATLLRRGEFKAAFEACEEIIRFCGEVAAALEEPGGLTADQLDSDDDEEENGEGEGSGSAAMKASAARSDPAYAEGNNNKDMLVRQRRAAAKKLGEQSGHVYMLLKAYVRSAAALCGLKEYHKAHGYLERALRITPYDNDLRDDCNRLAEKIRMETLVAISAGSAARQKAVPA
jgi:dyslexia susceptibility 1 candidate gene 1 protein